MKVLMATDGSRDANTAILSALRLLRPEGLAVDVLCVASELVRAFSGRDHYKEEAKRVLRSTQELLNREGLSPRITLKVGDASDILVASASDYDLIVVGAHGRLERTQPGLGLVARRLVENSPGSVMVGRDLTNDRNFRVLVALDGSTASFNALKALTVFLNSDLADVTLMHVAELPWARLDIPEEGPDFEPDAAELSDYQRELKNELNRGATLIMDRARDFLEAHNIAATEIIQDGDPALELVSHSEEGGYDLIIAGATGSSDVKHALLGSVSSKLAWDAPCSVLVVRP